ncbi:hypothetical protein [Couchioplanes caeruleus]|uniref:Serine/threonine protein phosphatase PrpC n=2 Tax=Couchioplanes caeruleus TaxID=56438 RepID=A0A1K0FYB9_9ACTN|nr:hypothetical protein [Couchioplanes caeruleus]OJF10066.1 hypothetical protein BG844_34035 [Couchioplanes caeruleus subsp. caeruleus]ROP31367.1 hypothetical protein EDD30_4266 [Couchioplanes caeruleus]
MDEQQHLAVLAVAIPEVEHRPQIALLWVRRQLLNALEDACGDAGVDWEAVLLWDKSDSLYLFVPPPATTIQLAGIFVWALERGLKQRNRDLSEAYQVRVRMALTDGICQLDGAAWLGDPVTDARRLLHAERLRDERLVTPRPPLAFIVTDEIYRKAIIGSRLSDEESFYPVTVARPDGRAEQAWVQAPAYVQRPRTDPEDAPADRFTPARNGGPGRHGVELTALPVARRPLEVRVAAPPQAAISPFDTVADGWSTEHFAVRYASVCGTTRRDAGASRLDGIAAMRHAASGATVFALTDGAPARLHAWQEASAVSRAVVDAIMSDLDAEADQIDWQRAVRQSAWPLVAGMVRPTASGLMAWLVQVGDCAVWLRRGGVYRRVPELAPDQTFALVVTGPPDTPHLTPRVTSLSNADVLLVGSSGVRDAVGGDPHRLDGLLTAPQAPLDFAYGLKLGAGSFGDDRTLFALWVASAD